MSQSQHIPIGGGAIACPSSEQLLAFASGVADEATSASLAQHIAGCASCEQVFRSIESSADPLTSRVRLALQSSPELDESECFRMIQAAAELGAARDPLAAGDELPATHSLAGTPDDVSDATRYQSLPTASWTPLPIGESIGRYRLESLLGEGTFGRVYLAHDSQLDRPVALKVAKTHELGEANLLAAFLSEARSAARLRHPGIVSIFDVGSEGDFHFIAMEHVPGQSLRALLVGKPQPTELVADVIAQAAEAMHYAHKQGLMHRDLKPANLLRDADGRVRIADFGLALHEDQQRKRVGDRAGTLPYMSPEQVRGDSHRLDGRADVWSLGVIMYELLAGRRPFLGRPSEVEDEILHRPPKPLRQIRDDVDQELEAICLKCLAKDPQQRFSSAKDLAEALTDWQQAADEPPKKTRRRSRAILSLSIKIAVYAGCLLLLVSLLTSGWYLNRANLPNRALLLSNRREPPPIWPYPVDKMAKPERWLQLLDQPPETTFFERGLNQSFSYDRELQKVTMDSRTITLLGLGETSSHAYIIQVALTKSRSVGYGGIFLGYEQLPPQDGRPAWHGQLIFVTFEQGKHPAVCRTDLTLIETRNGIIGANTYEMARVSLTPERMGAIAPQGTTEGKPVPERVERSLLEVVVRRGMIDEIRWQRRPLPELKDPKQNEHGDVPGCVGRFGLVNNQGSTIFSDARFMPLASPSP